MPMLDGLLAGEKFWSIKAPLGGRIKKMREVHAAIKEEHEWMLEHEAQDRFHICVLLGALNLIEGLLDIK